jgi:hypothetical protein
VTSTCKYTATAPASKEPGSHVRKTAVAAAWSADSASCAPTIRADAPLLGDDGAPACGGEGLSIDADLLLAMPTVLGPGLSTGFAM